MSMSPVYLSLMHHFVTATTSVLPFAQQTGADHIMRVDLPRLAIEHDFMLHILLGIASMHKYYLLQESADHSQVVYHRVKSLSGLRTALSNFSDKNSHGVLGASLLLVVLACDPMGTGDEGELWTSTWFGLFAGMRHIVKQVSWKYLVQTGLSPLFIRDCDQPAPLSAVPSPLREMLSSAEVEEQDLDILSKTMQSLGSLYALLRFGMSPRLGIKIIA
jgi:hypothetical protein